MVAGVGQRSPELIRDFRRTGDSLVEDAEDAEPERMRDRFYEPGVGEVDGGSQASPFGERRAQPCVRGRSNADKWRCIRSSLADQSEFIETLLCGAETFLNALLVYIIVQTAPPAPRNAESSVMDAYEALAPYYDRFTREYEHARWLSELERWASAEGLPGRRVLDVACGTGKSFEPLLERGYHVTACDISPQMVLSARRRGNGRANVLVADMRALPWRQEFDLVTCINDAVNYLLTKEDLRRALCSMAAALVPGGVAVFDANSLVTYRTAFAERIVHEDDECLFEWDGSVSGDFRPGDIASATLTVLHSAGTCATEHVQRHWPVTALRRACRSAGFERVLIRGQIAGARLVGAPDEERHPKLVCLAVRSERPHEDARRVIAGGAPGSRPRLRRPDTAARLRWEGDES